MSDLQKLMSSFYSQRRGRHGRITWPALKLSGQFGRVERSRQNRERCKSMFIWPCYPSEVLKGGERGAPFVPQEPADGCNPFQNAHWKSIKTGWTWGMSVEAGDTFLREGVPQKNTSWVKQASLMLSRPKKKYCKERQREWIATPSNEGPLATPPFELNTAAISSPYPGGWHRLQGVRPQKPPNTDIIL